MLHTLSVAIIQCNDTNFRDKHSSLGVVKAPQQNILAKATSLLKPNIFRASDKKLKYQVFYLNLKKAQCKS